MPVQVTQSPANVVFQSPTLLSTGGITPDLSPIWSPNNQRMIFRQLTGTGTQAYTLQVANQAAAPVLIGIGSGIGTHLSWRATFVMPPATPTPSPTPTRTPSPTPTPLPSCVFDATTLIYYRAPITGNPRQGTLQYSSTYNFVANQRFVDHTTQIWYRISSVELDSQPGVNQDTVVANSGGVWVPSFGSPISGYGCNGGNSIPLSNMYTMSSHSWSAFSVPFGGWPVDVQSICDTTTTPREIHALGIGSPSLYPRNTHTGVDLFVPNSSNNVQVRSLGAGIVVGIGRGTSASFPFTHAYWGASTLLVSGQLSDGWSVIVRHGHLFVLYGHLATLDANIWVGRTIPLGTILGTQGSFNDRHLHIEVHSFGSTIATGIGTANAAQVGSFGILPVNKTAEQFVAPFLYDVMQMLPDPIGYLSSANANLALRSRLATSQLSLVNVEGQQALNLVGISQCNFLYRTVHPTSSTVVDEASGYRGFVAYPDFARTLPSPLTQTQQP